MTKEHASYLAEFIATFTLCLVVLLSLLGRFPLPIPIVVAITLGLFVYSIGHISGVHINPAITIGLLSIKKITTQTAVKYVIAQCLGAFVALWAAQLIGIPTMDFPTIGVTVGLAEAVGTFFFSFGVAAVVTGRVDKSVSGIMIGGSLLLGIIIASSLGSVGILNPAVTLALRLFSPIYLLGPIIGSVAGFNLYTWLNRSL